MAEIPERIRSIDASGVRRMFDACGPDTINLSLGEPDFDVPDSVKRACISAVRAGKNGYTPNAGITELRCAIARKLRKENKIRADEDEIIATCGAIGGLSIAFQTLLEDGDEVVLFDPYFVAYERLARLNGAKPVSIDTYPDFAIRAEDIESKVTARTKAIIANSPCNPTGRVYSGKELKAIAAVADEHDLVVISDEVYEKFTYEKRHVSIGSIYDKTVTINGFSKSHAMTGWRIGYMHGPRGIIEQALKLQQFNFTCAPAPFQYAALAALKTSVRAHVGACRRKRDMLWDSLHDCYEFVKPEGAFFAFARSPIPAQQFAERCIERGMAIVPGDAFSGRSSHFRVSFATSRENLKRAAAILRSLA